jgi:hypothetical protein
MTNSKFDAINEYKYRVTILNPICCMFNVISLFLENLSDPS